MEVYQNIKSGKYFIHIESIRNNSALFVTPPGDVKSLYYGLFSEPDDFNEKELLQNKMVTENQISCYQSYRTNRDMEPLMRIKEFYFDHLPESQKKEFIKKVKMML